MDSVTIIFSISLIVLTIHGLYKINPKLDVNNITNERILWYTDPSDFYTRKYVVLWKIQKK